MNEFESPNNQRDRELTLLTEVDFAAIELLTVVDVLKPELPAQLTDALGKLAEKREAVSQYRSRLIAQYVNNNLSPLYQV